MIAWILSYQFDHVEDPAIEELDPDSWRVDKLKSYLWSKIAALIKQGVDPQEALQKACEQLDKEI